MARTNLSADAKDALTRLLPDAVHCRVALREGLAYYGATNSAHGPVFRTRRLAVARLFRTLLDGGSGIRKGADLRLYRTTNYEIDLPGAGPPPKARARCDRRIEMRAAFLAAGSLAAPAHGYHLEFVLADAEHAARLEALFSSEGLDAKRTTRKGRIVVYFKGLDAIVAVLVAIGAHSAVLHLEDVRAMKETKNRIHRLVNTETANVVRAASAAAAQREAITYLADAYGLRNLSPPLREAAHLRLSYPDETLVELGRRAQPPVGKATINGRIAALLRLVKRLREPGTKGSLATGRLTEKTS